jgi:hypothetical protein
MPILTEESAQRYLSACFSVVLPSPWAPDKPSPVGTDTKSEAPTSRSSTRSRGWQATLPGHGHEPGVGHGCPGPGRAVQSPPGPRAVAAPDRHRGHAVVLAPTTGRPRPHSAIG